MASLKKSKQTRYMTVFILKFDCYICLMQALKDKKIIIIITVYDESQTTKT